MEEMNNCIFIFFLLSCVRNWILFKSVRVFLKAWDGKRDSVKEREEIERKAGICPQACISCDML